MKDDCDISLHETCACNRNEKKFPWHCKEIGKTAVVGEWKRNGEQICSMKLECTVRLSPTWTIKLHNWLISRSPIFTRKLKFKLQILISAWKMSMPKITALSTTTRKAHLWLRSLVHCYRPIIRWNREVGVGCACLWGTKNDKKPRLLTTSPGCWNAIQHRIFIFDNYRSHTRDDAISSCAKFRVDRLRSFWFCGWSRH